MHPYKAPGPDGNGNDVHIWKDNWLPRCPSKKPLVPRILPLDAKVSCLIDVDTNQWNQQLIHYVFLPFNAKDILKILLNFRLPQDTLFWQSEKNGNFSVRSYYHFARILASETESQPGSSNMNNWPSIWRNEIPPKVRHFCWKLLNDSLSTLAALERRGV